jgi:hypothetical protein
MGALLMDVDSSQELSQFSVGGVLGITFSTFFRNPFVYMGLCALIHIPGLISYLMGGYWALASAFIYIVLIVSIQGSVAYGVFEALMENVPSFGASLWYGLSRFFSLFVASLPVGFLFTLMRSALASLRVLEGPALILSIIIMSLIAMGLCMWSVFAPACVVERLGAMRSLKRSSELTKGCRFKIACLYILFFLMSAVFVFATTFFISYFLLRLFERGIVLFLFRIFSVFFIVNIVVAFWSVLTSVIYYALREVKEDMTLDRLANVFD